MGQESQTGFNPLPLPEDDKLYLLLVETTDEWYPTEDSATFRTIGSRIGNSDDWYIAGWCWTHNEFITITGNIIGWLPLPPAEVNDARSN